MINPSRGRSGLNGLFFTAERLEMFRNEPPEDERLLRGPGELGVETLKVDPVPGYGAIESGEHRFYERKGDGPERLAGFAVFTMLWKLDAGSWKRARVMSYGHRAAP